MTIPEQIRAMAAERRAQIEGLGFQDANLWLGEPAGFPLAKGLAPEPLTEAARSFGIRGGLVSHWDSRRLAAQDGNLALEAGLAEMPPEYYGIWTGLPLLPGETGPIPGIGPVPARMRGVRISPKFHNYPLAGWMLDGLCGWLSTRRIPLFLWHTESDWSALHALAQAWPHLPIVVETQDQKILYHTRPLFALLRDCRNVKVELSNLAGQGFVEHAARHYGADRLLFGSFLPVNDPWVPMGMLLDADLPEADKALIAGGNLRNLIAGVRE
jgi:hypothetical protein